MVSLKGPMKQSLASVFALRFHSTQEMSPAYGTWVWLGV